MQIHAIAITTTSDDKSVLESIAKRLIKDNLAACVQISGPLESWYPWQGQLENSTEWQCAIKTQSNHFAAINNLITELHNYDEPQLIALPIVDGSDGYLKWLKENSEP